jgi:hypothetical protein
MSYLCRALCQARAARASGRRRVAHPLTGLKDFDYAALTSRRDTAVLQMANEDLTDHTLQYLKGMTHLHSLDVSGTQITDEGLRVLAELPRLRELRLARTKTRSSKGVSCSYTPRGIPAMGVQSAHDWYSRPAEGSQSLLG